jgi:LacI family transcriptional regulator
MGASKQRSRRLCRAVAVGSAPGIRFRTRMSASDKNPTILDVARVAGVSVGTVSNVLNGRGNVSAARHAQVSAAMAKLDFVPNRVAQSLRRSESQVIGLCVPVTSSAYFAALLDIFERLAAAQGYAIMQVLSHGDPALELRRVRALVGRNVDGLILIPTFDSRATLDLLAERRTPTVLVDRMTGDRRFDYVAIDDRRAMHDATCHLLELGHRRLLYVVFDARLATTQRRIQGYADAAKERAPLVAASWLQRDPDEAVFARQVADALAGPDRPTAIIASNSAIALSLVGILRALEVRWPDDLSLMAFDEPIWAPIVTPPLAVVRHPTEQIASEAWRRLMLRLRDPALGTRRITLQAQLMPTASLGPPPLEDRGRRHLASGGSNAAPRRPVLPPRRK